MKIKKGDTVKVIAGKDSGKTGKVVRALPSVHQVIVEGVNMRTRHKKLQKDTKQGGGIITFSAPMHVSNVQIVDPKTHVVTRVGITIDSSNKRTRVTKKSGTILK